MAATETGRAGHALDAVILELVALRGKTKHEPTLEALVRCEQGCEQANRELRNCVKVLERVADDPDGIGDAKHRLARVVGLPETAPMAEVLTVAALALEEVIRQQAEEVPA